MSEAPEGAARTRAGTGSSAPIVGWVLLAVLAAYAVLLHHGLGPVPDGEVHFYSPRGFLLYQGWIAPFEERPVLGVAVFALPALLLAAGVFGLTRSAIARMLAASCVVAAMLFPFYGLRPPGPGIWGFFGWRGSAVMAGLALALGATLTAPLLARSWLALPTAGRIAVYLPVLVGIVALMRNVTGTDPSLRFAISPWPVVPLFGLRIGSMAILGVIAGMACAAWSLTLRRPAWRAGGLVAAVLVPPVWFKLWHASFPVQGMLLMGGAAGLLVVGSVLGRREESLTARGRSLSWGFLLAFLPLAAGQAWASWDYTRTREGTARTVIDALAAFYEEHREYPEELSELVAAGWLDRVPRPSIGFGFIGEQDFQYQSFGTGYNLEFSSPDWVQCAYNPAWSEEDWDDYEDPAEDEDASAEEADDGSAEDETSLGEAWSCPSSPPELW